MKSYSSYTNVEDAQIALALASVNPNIGGILLSGKTGVGKTALVKSLANILTTKKIIKLPLSISEDALIGSLDIEQTITTGIQNYNKSILHNADGNILYIDNINLISSGILNKILQINDAGYFYTKNDEEIKCKFTIIATMNPDEGGITSKLLDKFGLFIELSSQNGISERLEILKEAEKWDRKPKQQLLQYEDEDKKWQQKINQCEALLNKVKIRDKDIKTIAEICRQSFIAGHRGDIALLWASATYAAFNKRNSIAMDDILKVKDWALAHRIRSPKQEANNNNEQKDNNNQQENNNKNKENKNQQQPDNNKKNNTDNNKNKDNEFLPEQLSNDNNDALNDNLKEESWDIGDLEIDAEILQNNKRIFEKHKGSGKRIKCIESEGKGRHIRSKRFTNNDIHDIDFVSTLRTAAVYQGIRASNGLAINIKKDDFRKKVREHRIGNTILFLVDASGSMGIKQRMKEAKAGVFSLLKDAYVHRDKVALMTFRKEESKLLLPPTRSISRAHKLLKDIKTGGRTPLFNGLQTAFELLVNIKVKDKNNIPILILFTDGKATSTYKGENTQQALKEIARKYADFNIKTHIVDTECGFIKLGYAKTLADLMKAEYHELDNYILNKSLVFS